MRLIITMIRELCDKQRCNMLFIQEIETNWTKQSRGGKGAVKRNAIPERFPLPSRLSFADNPLTVVHQCILFWESKDFQQTETMQQSVVDPKDRERFKGLWITPQEDGYLLQFAWNEGVGAPIRQRFPRIIGLLQGGEWAQIKLNGRFSGEDYWYYHKTVYNVAYVTSLVDLEMILTCTPMYIHDAMAELW